MKITRCLKEMEDTVVFIVEMDGREIHDDPDVHALNHTLNVLKTRYR